MSPPDPPVTLLDALASVPDPRGRRGRSYTLTSILAPTVAAMLCGFGGYRAIAQWGRLYNHLAPRLGFHRPARDGPGYRIPFLDRDGRPVVTGASQARRNSVRSASARHASSHDRELSDV